ncbi:protein AGENET DOMAIN (AGD)-CONTAINING P1 isoform X2 [Apium graveolens]|uniref:protein AGENET DOMAIN (AGD)-CONTAINING P1 isoform X2 n=1 Tax=Apium graveolens TaxID=4045 RepID=UPI003D7A6666
MSPSSPPLTGGAYFKRGDTVEVLRLNLFYSLATVLQPPGPTHRHNYFVQFQTLENNNNDNNNNNLNNNINIDYDNYDENIVREYVRVDDVRPVPPIELNMFFMVGNVVDAFFDNEGWRKGEVNDILENSRYEIVFDEGKLVQEFDQWNVRLHRVWDDGCWDPPLQLQFLEPCLQKSSEMTERPSKLKVRVKHPRGKPEEKFPTGMLVEVKSGEEGFTGAWYTAKVLGLVGNDMFLIEYQKLKSEDKSRPLKENVNGSCIRPCPPDIQHTDCFKQLEQVDALINEGWWEGQISKVLSEVLYIVYFASTEEEMLFERSQLRSHQEWVDGKWVSAYKTSSTQEPQLKFKVKCNGRKSAPKFSRGTMVEVRSDEQGYHGSWYTAVIIEILKNGKYMIEYQTLRTEDEAELLKEMADGCDVRPVPPKIERVDRFKMLEEVDAWYNDGWWMGHVSKVLDGFKYLVYFWTTNEEIEFHHFKLRPRQEWIFGKWNFSLRKQSKLAVKPTLRELKVPCGKGFSVINFSKWAKVEVKSSEDYYEGLWFPAIVLSPIKKGKYLVEFLTMTTAETAELLREEADALMMRPCPPITQRVDRYKPLEEVDAWYRGGWSVGQVCKVFNNSRAGNYELLIIYIVQFWSFDSRTLSQSSSYILKLVHDRLEPSR